MPKTSGIPLTRLGPSDNPTPPREKNGTKFLVPLKATFCPDNAKYWIIANYTLHFDALEPYTYVYVDLKFKDALIGRHVSGGVLT